MKDNKKPERKVEDKNKELLDKVKEALKELGADVQAVTRVVIDEKGYIRVVAVPQVIDATGLQKEEDARQKNSHSTEGKTEGERAPQETEQSVRSESDA